MGSAVDYITNNYFRPTTNNDIYNRDTTVASGTECIKYYNVSINDRGGIDVTKKSKDNSSNLGSDVIVSDFLESGWRDNSASKSGDADSKSVSTESISLIDILSKSQWLRGDSTSKKDQSIFDIDVDGPHVYCLELDIGNIYVDPKVLSFAEFGGKFDHLKFYRNCGANQTTLRRLAFSLIGSPDHRASMRRPDGENGSIGHKFNLHFILTDSRDVDDEDRKTTEIIFDPKARDGGSPPPPPPPPGP